MQKHNNHGSVHFTLGNICMKGQHLFRRKKLSYFFVDIHIVNTSGTPVEIFFNIELYSTKF